MNAESMLRKARDQIFLLRELHDSYLGCLTSATKTTTNLSGSSGESADQDKFASRVIKVAEAGDLFEQKKAEYRAFIAECYRLVESVGGLEMQVLFRHYFKAEKLSDIAKSIGYSEQWIREVHGRGLTKANRRLRNGKKNGRGES